MDTEAIHVAAEKLLKDAGVVITGSHFVYTSGRHGPDYVNKDALYANPGALDNICGLMADYLARHGVTVVVGPAVGGVNLSQGTARHLNEHPLRVRMPKVSAAYAERDEEVIAKYGDGNLIIVGMHGIRLPEGASLVVKKDGFVLKRGYDKLVSGGKKVIVVEDILTTGGSAARTVQAVQAAGGEVIGVVAVCNRGQITAKQLGVPMLFSLTSPKLESWAEDEMPDWLKARPVDITVGHGKAYMERKRSQ